MVAFETGDFDNLARLLHQSAEVTVGVASLPAHLRPKFQESQFLKLVWELLRAPKERASVVKFVHFLKACEKVDFSEEKLVQEIQELSVL